MNSKDLILRYLSEKMGQAEKLQFEKILSDSEPLREELEKTKKILSAFNYSVNTEIDKYYFSDQLRLFHSRQEQTVKKYTLEERGINIAFGMVAIIIFIMFLRIDKEGISYREQDSFTYETVLEDYSDFYGIQLNLISLENEKSLELGTDSFDKIIENSFPDYLPSDDRFSIYSIESFFTEDEMNEMYAKIKNKKLL
ncbi:MAG: hypothetical protein JW995_10750 [Melioribacteraceae bacterium]|nr:hypothetical protein [Melioribacteraceae bacterium]